MDKFYTLLEKRQDKGITPYHLRNCAYMDDFSKQKIIYPVINKSLDFCIDTDQVYLNDKCFFITGNHLHYLCALLNSSLFKFCYRSSFPDLGEAIEIRKSAMDLIRIKPIHASIDLMFRSKLEEFSRHKNDPLVMRAVQKEIDLLIFKIFEIDSFEQEIIEQLYSQ